MKKSLSMCCRMMPVLFSTLMICGSCGLSGSKEESPEVQAGRMLDTARTYLGEKKYQDARSAIYAMRKKYPTAFEARARGIIVMDSVELQAARDSLMLMDSVLQAEQVIFTSIEAQSNAMKKDEFYEQRAKVYRLTQDVDMMSAKVKFYLRKLDVDIENEHH